MCESSFYWLIIKLSPITRLFRLVQVTKLSPFLLSLDHRPERCDFVMLDCWWLKVRMARVKDRSFIYLYFTSVILARVTACSISTSTWQEGLIGSITVMFLTPFLGSLKTVIEIISQPKNTTGRNYIEYIFYVRLPAALDDDILQWSKLHRIK